MTRDRVVYVGSADGTVLRPGDWIVYEPGSQHGTRTETGCLLLGIDWDPPAGS